MYVIKRSGIQEQVSFDKITERLKKLCDESPQLNIDPVIISQKVVSGVYPGVTTRELDTLAAEQQRTLRRSIQILVDLRRG